MMAETLLAVCALAAAAPAAGTSLLDSSDALAPRSWWRFEDPSDSMAWPDTQNATALTGRDNGQLNNDAQPWFPHALGGVVGGFIGLSEDDLDSGGVANESDVQWFSAGGGCLPAQTEIDPKTNKTWRGCDGPKEISGVTIEYLVKLGKSSAKGSPGFRSDPYDGGKGGVLSSHFGFATCV
jgi:hypothetical protein